MDYENTQKARTGLDRIWRAGVISMQGIRAAGREKAFRQEVFLAVILVPLALFFARTWEDSCLLIIPIAMVLVAEIINSAIEAAIDRIGPERHPLSGAAKDMGSAAVFVCLCLTVLVWTLAIWHRF